jgi:glycosyltransferase involved in cell wall biosynthesis
MIKNVNINYKIIYQFISLFTLIFFNLYYSFINANKISVIIPTYNREKLIVKSIKSVLNQTYRNFEIIIIDDCSSDNTINEINKLKDNRIRYIKIRKNKGANFCRNLGIKKSTGEYISFLDSDDIYYFNKLEKQIKNIKKNKSNFDFCKFSIYINNKNNRFSLTLPNSFQVKNIINGKILDELCKGNFISTQSIIINKKILNKYLFDIKMPRLQDYDLILRIIPKVKISFTNEVLVDLFIQNDSIGSSLLKLENAIPIILKKNYNLNLKQKKYLLNNLNSILESQKYLFKKK